MSSPLESDERLAEAQLEQPNTHDALRGEEAEDSNFAKITMRKVDVHVLPIFGIIYTIAYIDRANISVARISGLDEDLQLDVGSRASIALLLFFVGYIIFELPSNILIKRVGAPNWISIITVAWGAFTIGQGFIHSWVDLAILRTFLGAFEAGLYPGFVYLITCWYKRYEVQKRLAFFFFLAQGLASFGNILAYGLIQISRYTPNYHGWRWIYIIEGAITVLVGIVSRFIIVDFPASHRTTFLEERQKSWVLRRLQDDVGDEDKSPVSWAIIWATVKDWQIWCYSFMYMTGAIGGYGLNLFIPIILQDSLGFSHELAFILVIPPILFAVLVGATASWLADRVQRRGPFIVGLGITALIGFCTVGFLSNSAARLVGVFLGYAGVNGFTVTSLAWQSNNIRGDAKRAIATAIIVMMSGVGGIYSSLTFRQQDAPNYVPGIISVIVPSVITILLAIVTSWVLGRHNKQADEEKRVIEGSKDFRYTL